MTGLMITNSTPLIFIVAAMDRQRVIGIHNHLPWNLPDDLQHFRALTTGKPVIMGRKTFESIGRPLHHRQNIVLTSDTQSKLPGVTTAGSVSQALVAAADSPEVAIIGGSSVFTAFLPMTDRLELTIVDACVDGDTFFPDFDKDLWHEVSRKHHEPDERHAFGFDFVTLERKQTKLI